MKTFILFISLSILIGLWGCSQQKYLSSNYQKPQYENFENISTEDYSFDEKNNIFYLLSNNEENLFIHLKIADENIQKKILLFGLTSRFETNEQKLEVRYPLPMEKFQSKTRSGRGSESNQNKDFPRLRTTIISQATMIEIIGGESDSDRLIRDISKDGVRGEMEITDYGELCYRLTIPLSDLGIEQINENTFLSTVMESGHMNPENMQPSMRQRGMGKSMQGSTGMSMRGGGRSHSKTGGGRMQENSALSTPFKLKLGKIQLLLNEEN